MTLPISGIHLVAEIGLNTSSQPVQPPPRFVGGAAATGDASALDGYLDMDSILYIMKSITYTAAREKLAATMDQVCEDRAPVVITRNRDQAVVMLSLEEYESLEETAYLLRSPANARRLLASIRSMEKGKGKVRKLIEI